MSVGLLFEHALKSGNTERPYGSTDVSGHAMHELKRFRMVGPTSEQTV